MIDFGGFPFINDSFQSTRLLAAVLAVRCYKFGVSKIAKSQKAKLLLSPSIHTLFSDEEYTRINSTLVSDDDYKLIKLQISGIAERFPKWETLLKLPVRFEYISTPGVISCSSPGYPQHIFLSKEAFRSEDELREQILHEFCHNWLYLIQELIPLTRIPIGVKFTLPSGTQNRTAEELLGATHVAATLLIYYSESLKHSWMIRVSVAKKRIVSLSDYLDKCIHKLNRLNDENLLRPSAVHLLSTAENILKSTKVNFD